MLGSANFFRQFSDGGGRAWTPGGLSTTLRRMASFTATMSYELHPGTESDAAKLLRAELVGRRWQDRWKGERMPANTVWIHRSAEPEHTTDDVHAACAQDLYKAVAAVAATGRKIALLRAWVQVSGAGTYGPVPGKPGAPGAEADR